jgi:hypothetical protein
MRPIFLCLLAIPLLLANCKHQKKRKKQDKAAQRQEAVTKAKKICEEKKMSLDEAQFLVDGKILCFSGKGLDRVEVPVLSKDQDPGPIPMPPGKN